MSQKESNELRKPLTGLESFKEEMKRLTVAFECAESMLNTASSEDYDLIDAAIYKMQSVNKEIDRLIKSAKQEGLICQEIPSIYLAS
jgi:hypothetical protein